MVILKFIKKVLTQKNTNSKFLKENRYFCCWELSSTNIERVRASFCYSAPEQFKEDLKILESELDINKIILRQIPTILIKELNKKSEFEQNEISYLLRSKLSLNEDFIVDNSNDRLILFLENFFSRKSRQIESNFIKDAKEFFLNRYFRVIPIKNNLNMKIDAFGNVLDILDGNLGKNYISF